MRRVLFLGHMCVGLASAPFLILLGLTGAALVFENEIAAALNPRVLRVAPGAAALPLDALCGRLGAGAKVLAVGLPVAPDRSLTVTASLPRKPRPVTYYVNPYDGRILGTASGVHDPMRTIHQLHTHLLAGPAGSSLMVAAACGLLLLAVSGLVLWWPRGIVSVRPGKRFVFD